MVTHSDQVSTNKRSFSSRFPRFTFADCTVVETGIGNLQKRETAITKFDKDYMKLIEEHKQKAKQQANERAKEMQSGRRAPKGTTIQTLEPSGGTTTKSKQSTR